jgi:nucleolar GTP-binding protein
MSCISCYTEEGVMEVRNLACDRLLAARVEMKLKGTKVQNVINKLHLAQPVARDDRERPAFIPEAVKGRTEYDSKDPMRIRLARDIEVENGGAGVYNVDLKENYLLKHSEWNHDVIPEIMNGKNVADFIDPEIEEKLAVLEEEEERLIAEGFYNSDIDSENEETEIITKAAKKLKSKRDVIILAHRAKLGKNRTQLPHKAVARVSTPNSSAHDSMSSRLISPRLETRDHLKESVPAHESAVPNRMQWISMPRHVLHLHQEIVRLPVCAQWGYFNVNSAKSNRD